MSGFNWIPVEEGLPHVENFYLVTIFDKHTGKYHTEQDLFINRTVNGKEMRGWCKDGFNYEVKAWGFIPQPYRG